MVMIHQFGAWPDCIAMKRMRRLGEYIQRPTRQGVAITLSAGERESIRPARARIDESPIRMRLVVRLP